MELSLFAAQVGEGEAAAEGEPVHHHHPGGGVPAGVPSGLHRRPEAQIEAASQEIQVFVLRVCLFTF